MLIASNWWSLALRGLLGILIGVVTFLWPTITLSALVLIFGAYALIDGVLSLAGAWRRSQAHRRWGSLLLEGIFGVAAGIVAIFWPVIAAVTLIAIIAVWAMFTGIAEIVTAIHLRKHIRGEWLLGLLGATSVLFGVLLLVAPLAGAVVIALWFGAYALVTGILLTVLAFRLRKWRDMDIPQAV
jgi:uncharacterized membrane protein HdeD (DUF308 family)